MNHMQWIAIITFFILTGQAGINHGWSSPNIARFTSNESEIELTRDEVSWIASSTYIGGAVGAVSGPISVNIFGPKQTALLAFSLFSLSWMGLFIASDFVWLFVARLIGGLCGTMTNVCTVIFLGEISTPKTRGTAISIVLTGSAAGRVLATYLEAYFSPKVTSPIYLAQCLIGAIMIIFVLPESPYFLMKSKRLVKAKKSIIRYFSDEDVDEKFISIQIFLQKKARFSTKEKTSETVGSKSIVKLLLFMFLLCSLVESSGFPTIVLYMEVILRRGQAFMIEPKNVVIIDNIMSLVLRLMTCNVIDKIGRKILLVSSSITIAVVFSCLGIYFHLMHSGFELDYFRWVPVVCLLTFKASFTVGFYTSLQTLLSELFPVNVKNSASCMAQLTASFFNFVSSIIFLPVSNSIGEQYMFWYHALCALLVTPFVIFFIPETKGKKLEEI